MKRPKLTGQTRAALIASHAYGTSHRADVPADDDGGSSTIATLKLSDGLEIKLTPEITAQLREALAVSSPVAKAPKSEDAETPDADTSDDAKIMDAINTAIALQEKDPDETDPNDVKVLDALKAAKAAQEADTAEEASEEPAEEKPSVTASGDEDLAVAVEPAEPVEDENLNAPPEVTASENLGPEFSGVLVIEGQPTGDGRQIAADALTWRDPPLPLMLLATETHDPDGFDMNDPAVMAGRIETLTREAGESDTQLIRCTGHFLATDEGAYAAELTEQMGRIGVSGDIAVQDREITITDADEYGFPLDGTETLTEGMVMGATACPFPAFQGCYIVLGDGSNLPDVKAIPQAAENPVTPAEPPAVVSSGGQLVHWLSYEECEACDEGIEVITASGGPTRPPASWFADPAFTAGDERLVEILDQHGKRGEKYACPVTVTDDGQVYGHIAPWGICHNGIGAACVVAPKSAADYAHFLRGQHVITAEGEKIRVGVLTADTGHASTSPSLSANAAMAHYDDTALAVADVAVGEDEYGIWVAGAVRPDATDEQVRKLRASSISGDWRNIGGQLELVAALCVNQPGFALAQVASGHPESLVAYGAQVMDALKHPVAEEQDLLKVAAPAIRRLAQRDARERISALT